MEIGTYMQWVKVLLGEAGKYFLVLLLAVLAIRLWRRWPKAAGSQKQLSLLLALLVSGATVGVGYASVCHSLGRLYCAYGRRAFRAGNLRAALGLFQQERAFWSSADASGEVGVSLLLLGEQERGTQYLAEAQAHRHGQANCFEAFYAGLYYFLHEQPKQAAPLLVAAQQDPNFWCNATKLLAVIALEDHRPTEAAQLMTPFQKTEVKEYDQAYVLASLALADGKMDNARALLQPFATAALPDFWKPRFERLRAQVAPKAL